MHLPHLIPAMKHYLWILKTCHSGADMVCVYECTVEECVGGRRERDVCFAHEHAEGR